MDGAAALKCNGYRLKSSLTGYLDKGSVHWRGRPSMWIYRGVYTEGAIFLFIETDQSETTIESRA